LDRGGAVVFIYTNIQRNYMDPLYIQFESPLFVHRHLILSFGLLSNLRFESESLIFRLDVVDRL